MKLNVLLGKIEHLSSSFKASIKDYLQFFSKQQGQFRGIRKTYNPRPDTIDLPSERESKAIITTVDEKLNWFTETNKEYIDSLFSVEATNASGLATAELVVEGKSFGKFTSLELLRLISLLEGEGFRSMYENIPVRSDAENWTRSSDELYNGRTVFSVPQQVGTKKSILKEVFILADPNVAYLKDTSKYTPITASKDTIVELGDWTVQHFTGEASHKERAEILRRFTRLVVAAKEALKVANEVVTVPSGLSSSKILGYLHTGHVDAKESL